jgi:hypothetical protein
VLALSVAFDEVAEKESKIHRSEMVRVQPIGCGKEEKSSFAGGHNGFVFLRRASCLLLDSGHCC